MKYAMKFQNEDVLVSDVRVEHGVLFAKIVARYYVDHFNGDACYLKLDVPNDIIVSGSFELVASSDSIYADIEEYQKAVEDLFDSDVL